MCNKSVDKYPHKLEFVDEYYKRQKMCYKTFDICPSAMTLFFNAL